MADTDLEQLIAARKSELADLSAALVQQDQRVQELKKQESALLENQVNVQNQIDELKKTYAAEEAALAELRVQKLGDVEQRAKELDSREKILNDMDASLKERYTNLDAREQSATDREQAQNVRAEKLAGLEKEIIAARADIEAKRKEVAALEEKTLQDAFKLRDEWDEIKKVSAEFETIRTNQEARAKELDQKAADLEQQTNDLAGISERLSRRESQLDQDTLTYQKNLAEQEELARNNASMVKYLEEEQKRVDLAMLRVNKAVRENNLSKELEIEKSKAASTNTPG